ncbi:MAG: hypothetical protein ACREUG_05830 [Steroidobacteraceae bacterium]
MWAAVGFEVQQRALLSRDPFGVPIATGTWSGSAQAAQFAVDAYYLHRAVPTIVGTRSKLIAYGNNRADYTFIPGGMIPGVVIVQPDFPELQSAWPFLWYENEYVVDAATTFVLAAQAAEAVAH